MFYLHFDLNPLYDNLVNNILRYGGLWWNMIRFWETLRFFLINVFFFFFCLFVFVFVFGGFGFSCLPYVPYPF